MIEIIQTDSTNDNFRILISKLDKELFNRYGQIQNSFKKQNIIETSAKVILVKVDDKPVGCGCYKKYNEDTVEIKRMYIDTKFRGQGLSKIILGELENLAKESGYKNTILETGNKQPEAIGLYKKSGYKLIENYGKYKGIETSICMTKQITD
jgi:putative acetyltransferase